MAILSLSIPKYFSTYVSSGVFWGRNATHTLHDLMISLIFLARRKKSIVLNNYFFPFSSLLLVMKLIHSVKNSLSIQLLMLPYTIAFKLNLSLLFMELITLNLNNNIGNRFLKSILKPWSFLCYTTRKSIFVNIYNNINRRKEFCNFDCKIKFSLVDFYPYQKSRFWYYNFIRQSKFIQHVFANEVNQHFDVWLCENVFSNILIYFWWMIMNKKILNYQSIIFWRDQFFLADTCYSYFIDNGFFYSW